jgi:hypothetical protein
LPACALILFAVACSYPGTRWIDWVVWGSAIALLGYWSAAVRPTRRRSPARHGSGADEQLLQKLERYRLGDGREAIKGKLVAEFAAGERLASLYVAFCPPFERLPHLDVNVEDHSSANVKLAQLLHHGAQLEVRLPHATDCQQRVSIAFVAVEADPSDATTVV